MRETVKQGARGCCRIAGACALSLGLLLSASADRQAAANEPIKLAVYGFELIDTSLEGEVSGPRADEQQRLLLIGEELRRRLLDSGRYELVDMAPASERIEKAGYIHGCNGCDATIAKDLDAEQTMYGTVQKVSNLILNVNLYVRDVETRELLNVWSVDIRGNTDKSWTRGVSYIVRNRLLRD